jgi:hypothetical protein
MKHVVRFAMFLTLGLFALACGDQNKNAETKDEHAAHDSTAKDQTVTSNGTSSTASLKDEELNAVYQHYIHLTTALTNTDAAEAKIAALAIEAGAKDMQAGSAIAAQASKIINANDIEVQRTAYYDMSNSMIGLVKKSGLKGGELYVDYCPMAFDDKGASWLSNNKEIRNPYFGDKMMKCGEIKETIK